MPLQLQQANAPGVYVSTDVAGFIPTELVPFNRTYCLGPSLQGAYAEPTQVVDLADADNRFGVAGMTERSLRLFFRNHPYGVMFFVRVPIGPVHRLVVTHVEDAQSYTVQVDAAPAITFVADALDTLATVATGIAALLNDEQNEVAQVTTAWVDPEDPTAILLRAPNPTRETPFTVTLTTTPQTDALTEADITGTDPTRYDWVWALENSFDPDEHRQGFLIAPEAFDQLPQGDRAAVGAAMHMIASREGFDWMALVDCGPTSEVATNEQTVADGLLYSAPLGHLAYYTPRLIDLEGSEVCQSAAVAAIALRRYQDQGFVQPPAGKRYPVQGVLDVAIRWRRQHQEVSNPQGINMARHFPGQGVAIYGSRTRSTSPYFRFVNTRVILNVLVNTLRVAFDSEIFTAIDGAGVLFTRIKETANAICYRLFIGGALFGATSSAAYYNKCDRQNNPDLDLEAGIVRLDTWVVPSPTMERLFISVARTPIGQIEVVTAALGATNTIGLP